MTFKYNPLTGELNIFGVKEQNSTPTPNPDQQPQKSGYGFWYYLENDTSVNFSSTNTFIPLPQLKESWNNTGVELSNSNEYVIPTAGVWIWTINPSVTASESSTLNTSPYLQLNGINFSALGGSWTGITVFNKGDKITAGFEVTFESGSQTSITLAKGIVSTYFTLMLLTPAVSVSTNTDNKNTNPNTSGNTTNPNVSPTPSKYPLTDFTVSPATILQYSFDGSTAGSGVKEPIINWVTSQGDHPLGTGTVTVSEDATWSFSWKLPSIDSSNGFSLNLQANVNGKALAQTSADSVSAPLKKGDQVNFNIIGYFPKSAPSNAQVTVTLEASTTSLTATKQG